MTGAIVSIAVVVAVIGAVVIGRQMRNSRRTRLRQAEFPQQWSHILRESLPLYERLSEDIRRELEGLVNVFIDEKTFYGCAGLEITDRIRVTVAAQACMLLLGRKTRFFGKLRTIYVYPRTYVANGIYHDGMMVVEGQSVRLGESWQNGPVVLAWDSVRGGAVNIEDGQNVVLHEFAHQLDQEDGTADGAPILESRSSYATWARVLSAEYEALRRKEARHSRSVMNKYGATNPAEFFAVATETFFEKPGQMQEKHPQLYEELKSYYKVDPVQWQ